MIQVPTGEKLFSNCNCTMDRHDHLSLLCDIGELDWIFHDTDSIGAFLGQIVELVARHLATDVCSVYLFNDEDRKLVLKATRGLNPSLVGKVRLDYGEGITGAAVKEMRTILDNHAPANPHYKFFHGLREEMYDAFCVAPILRGIRRIGALVVQRERRRPFTDEDRVAVQAVAGQLANIIESTRLLSSLDKRPDREPDEDTEPLPTMIKGRTAGAGFAVGPIHLFRRSLSLEELAATGKYSAAGLEVFDHALRETTHRLEQLQQRVEERLADSASLIFTAHLLLLKDEQFTGRMRALVRDGAAPAKAIAGVARQLIQTMKSGDNDYLSQRADDIKDLAMRLIAQCCSDESRELNLHGCIVVSHEVLPSDVLIMAAEDVAGIVTVGGGVTSHAAILARSLGIPMIITDERRMLGLPGETVLLLDGDTGNILVNPTTAMARPYREREEARRAGKDHGVVLPGRPATRDGTDLRVLANVNLLSDAEVAESLAFQGIGLYRTEFPFLIRSDFPTEEEQVVVYGKLVERMPHKQITFRTLDIGGDKVLSYFHSGREANPFLGMRSIRFALHNVEIFRGQIRAVLRAGHRSPVGIMFPMICSVEEFTTARRLVDECVAELDKAGVAHNSMPRVGVMIELPATVHIADELARHADFFSIGTNDLVQYMLGVDRTNEKVAHLYVPHHPAVLRALARIVEAAGAAGIPVSVCGDMGQDTRYLPFLIGVGVRCFSIDPVALKTMLPALQSVDAKEAETLARTCLAAETSAEIGRLLKGNRQ